MQIRRQPFLEQIPFTGLATIAVREFEASAFRYPWHQHPEVELTWILEGSGLRYVGDSVESFHAGDFCLLGGHLPHTWLSADGSPGRARSLVIQFDPRQWGSAFLALPEFAKVAGLLKRAAHGLHFESISIPKALAGPLQKASPLRKLTKLLEVLEQLADHPLARPLSLAPWGLDDRRTDDPRARTILSHLSCHASLPITQKDAARLVRLTPAAFSRFFRRTVGKTFSAYLTDLRLGEACRRLLESDQSISHIAFDVGFENLSTFNRSFRLRRGMSPREFRHQALPAPTAQPPRRLNRSR